MATDKDSIRVAIFGLGIVGKALGRSAEEAGYEVLGFSRSSSWGRGKRFDAASEEESRNTLERLSPVDLLFVTFPPQNAHPSFLERIHRLAPRRVLLGSTSIYERQGRGETITEESPLDPDHERIGLETEFLESGGRVVRLSGIYGGDRNPIRWVRQGRIGYEKRQVNLVHYEDIAAALTLLATASKPANVYNLSDGQSHTWQAIIDFLLEKELIEERPPERPPKKPHSFIDNSLFLSHFPSFEFRDFWSALKKLAE